VLRDRLGWGKDGVVFDTSADTALKAIAERRPYFNEISVYLRLLQREVSDVEGSRFRNSWRSTTS
jgi:hypothetical protein